MTIFPIVTSTNEKDDQHNAYRSHCFLHCLVPFDFNNTYFESIEQLSNCAIELRTLRARDSDRQAIFATYLIMWFDKKK
jgi:hypothetical protein